MATARKSKSTAVVPWEEEMAAAAHKQAKAEKPAGLFKAISIRGGILSIDDNPVKDNEIRAVALVGIPENQFYTEAFDSNNPQSPDCYAFGDPDLEDPEEGMKPHEACKNPQGGEDPDGEQGGADATCERCWANQFGSADKGRGKACKNVRRTAWVTEDALEGADALDEAEVRSLKVPVMSVQNWVKHVHRLDEEMSRPTWGVITLLKVVPDAKSQFKVQFGFEELVNFDQELYDAMKRKLKPLKADMTAPYPDFAEQEESPPRRGRQAPARQAKPAARGKVAAKKPAAKKGGKY